MYGVAKSRFHYVIQGKLEGKCNFIVQLTGEMAADFFTVNFPNL